MSSARGRRRWVRSLVVAFVADSVFSSIFVHSRLSSLAPSYASSIESRVRGQVDE